MTALDFLSDLTSGLDPVVLEPPLSADDELAFTFLPPAQPAQVGELAPAPTAAMPSIVAQRAAELEASIDLLAPAAGALRLLVPEALPGRDVEEPLPDSHLLQLRFDPAVVLSLSAALPAPYAGPSRVIWGPVEPASVREAMATLLASRDLEGADPVELLDLFMAGEDVLRVVAGEAVGRSAGQRIELELVDDSGFHYHPLFLFRRWREHGNLPEETSHPLWRAAEQRLSEAGAVELRAGRLQAVDEDGEPVLDLGSVQRAI
ncbi:MAG: hypothetical protein AAF560_26280 [Acidobacteriota bacterium]